MATIHLIKAINKNTQLLSSQSVKRAGFTMAPIHLLKVSNKNTHRLFKSVANHVKIIS